MSFSLRENLQEASCFIFALMSSPSYDISFHPVIQKWFKNMYDKARTALKSLRNLNDVLPKTREKWFEEEKNYVEMCSVNNFEGQNYFVLVPSWHPDEYGNNFKFKPILGDSATSSESQKSLQNIFMRAPGHTYEALKGISPHLPDLPELKDVAYNDFFSLEEQEDHNKVFTPPLLRPLLAIAKCKNKGCCGAKGKTSQNNWGIPDTFVKGDIDKFKWLVHFARASIPPGVEEFAKILSCEEKTFPPLWESWSSLLADGENGLYAKLKISSRHSIMSRGFLEALECGPQIFNRGTFLNVQSISTALQQLRADLSVQSLTVFANDSMWQWRNLQEGASEEKKIEEVLKLTPKRWKRFHSDLKPSDPISYAMRTQFNGCLIGETHTLESWGRAQSISEFLGIPAPGDFSNFKEENKFGMLVPELFLARLVPEAAGDPFTKEGRASIGSFFTLTSVNQRLSATFDCMMDLHEFPGDHQTLGVDFSSISDFNFARFLHHQSINFDKEVSMFAHWSPLGDGYRDTTIKPRKVQFPRSHVYWYDSNPSILHLECDASLVNVGDKVYRAFSHADVLGEVKSVDSLHHLVTLKETFATTVYKRTKICAFVEFGKEVSEKE